jgi:hypothetical protein
MEIPSRPNLDNDFSFFFAGKLCFPMDVVDMGQWMEGNGKLGPRLLTEAEIGRDLSKLQTKGFQDWRIQSMEYTCKSTCRLEITKTKASVHLKALIKVSDTGNTADVGTKKKATGEGGGKSDPDPSASASSSSGHKGAASAVGAAASSAPSASAAAATAADEDDLQDDGGAPFGYDVDGDDAQADLADLEKAGILSEDSVGDEYAEREEGDDGGQDEAEPPLDFEVLSELEDQEEKPPDPPRPPLWPPIIAPVGALADDHVGPGADEAAGDAVAAEGAAAAADPAHSVARVGIKNGHSGEVRYPCQRSDAR